MPGPFERQPGRSSFASTPAQPVQSQTNLSPGFRGGEVVGGDSEGGVVRASPMTAPTGDTGIPEFFARMVEPYVRQKQAEAVVKGATDVIAGRSIKDIAKGDSGIARIFGPSGYHQGAAAFAATSQWAQARSEILNDPDAEKLAPDQLGAMLSKKYQGMMTGDPVTDQLLSHTLLQDHAPLVATLTAKHEAWVQRQALGNWSNTLDGNAGTLQQIMSQPGDLNSPTLAAARQQAVGNYLSGLQKPHGMTDEVWQGGLASHAHAAVNSGNFFAFEALKARGLYNVLTDDQQARLDTAYQTAASHGLAQIAADPEINKQLATLDAEIRRGDLKSPAEIAAAAAGINQLAAQRTGIMGRQLISGDEVLAMQKQLNEEQWQSGLRVMEHQFQLEKETRDHQWELDKEAYKQAEGLRMAATAAGAGNVSPSLATGTVKETDVNAVFGRAVQSNNLGLLAHNFQNGRYVNGFAAQQLQSPVTNSLGVGVTVGFQQAYKQWQALHAANPAAAVAYYGPHAANMEGYNKAIHAGEPELSAYAETFGRAPDLGRLVLPDGVNEKNARAAVQDAIVAQDGSRLGRVVAGVGQRLGSRDEAAGRAPLAASSTAVLTDWLMHKAGEYARQSGISMDQAASKLYAAGLASGEIERAGPFAWTNPHGAAKLGASLALPDDSVDHLVTRVAGDKLRAAGFSQGTNGDNYSVFRASDPTGQPFLWVQAMHPDHSGHTDVVITTADLKAANRRDVQVQTEAAQANYKSHHTPFAIDISSKATAARRDGYRHAMDSTSTHN